MTKSEAMKQLKSLGTAQNCKVYKRHGVTGKAFGVSYANIGALKKQIKSDQALAEKLWTTENHDARILATMIAEPGQMTVSKLDGWVKDLHNYVLTDALSMLAAKSPVAVKCINKWTAAKAEWKASAGWNILAQIGMSDASLTNKELEAYIKTIESTIRDSKNRVRYSMNNALIAIGIRNTTLEKKATAAAKRIGKVEVDHGDTSCKTPDAVVYIRKAVARRQQRAK